MLWDRSWILWRKQEYNSIELFQLRYKTPLTFSIQDLENEQKLVLGTKVNLEIPIIS